MAFPKSNDFYNPILEYFYNKNEKEKYIGNTKLRDFIIGKFELTTEETELELKSGGNKLHSNIAWIITFLCQSGLLERPERGFVQITEEGKKIYDSKVKINTTYLKDNYPKFKEFSTPNKKDITSSGSEEDEEVTEVTNELYSKVDDYYELIENLILKKLFEISQNTTTKQKGDVLENISVELFEKMGYFDVKKMGGTNDGGIDGDFAIDKFGLERIAFQCKFFTDGSSVSSKDIDAFAGSLSKLGYQKGVFITTSKFSKTSEHKNITLIDGKKLSKLLRENKVLCYVKDTYNEYIIDDNLDN